MLVKFKELKCLEQGNVFVYVLWGSKMEGITR